MHKIHSLTRFHRVWILLLSFTFGSLATAQAQGFFKPNNHISEMLRARTTEVPGGYHTKVVYSSQPAIDSVFYLGNLHLNAAGNETAWDSTPVFSPFPHYRFANWLPDNDVIQMQFPNGDSIWHVRKSHLDGTVVWNAAYQLTLGSQQIFNVEQNAAGDVFLGTVEFTEWGIQYAHVTKFDTTGTILWTVTQPALDSSVTASYITPTQDGGCIMDVPSNKGNGPVLSNTTQRILYKISAAGVVMWSDTSNTYNIAAFPKENSLGEIYSWNHEYTSNPNISSSDLKKYGSSGQVIWVKNINTLLQKTSVSPIGVVIGQNGDVLLYGEYSDSDQNYLPFFARIDSAGNLVWQKRYPFLTHYHRFFDGAAAATSDNGFILTGKLPQSPHNLFTLKIDGNGDVFPGQLSGQLALDSDVDCQVDSLEQKLANWTVELVSPDFALYATTDSSGHYAMTDIPADNYLLHAVVPSPVWESCAGYVPLDFSGSDTLPVSAIQDLPIQIIAECPFMTIDLGASFMRRCASSTYSVHYCNQGTDVATGAYAQIVLDPLLHFSSASIAYTQSGDTLTFALGSVPVLGCGDFTFDVTVDCDPAVVTQTLCVDAHIFPDEICTQPANWSGALIEASGRCDGDSVRFELRNIGVAPTSDGLNFIIVDDHVIMMNQPLPTLTQGSPYQVAMPANGKTWHLIADQEPNAPGHEMPSIGVEGCTTGTSPSFGFLLQFANRDGNPFTDETCQEIFENYDLENNLIAAPVGIDEQHFIEPNTFVEYQVRFQNTGNGTATTLVLQDTLSAWLDPATVRVGAASHPYTWSLSGAGILTITFENILLPNTNTNEDASHGFVQFSIEQRPDNPLGALLENQVGIYSDSNAPLLTNTVWHTIGRNFLTSGTGEPKTALHMMQVSPNPANQLTTVRTNQPFQADQRLVLRTITGRIVRETAIQDSSTELNRAGLPAGLYFLELWQADRVLGVEKVVWE